jgi:hypothetical protein
VTIKHAIDEGFDVVEVTKKAEDAWVDLLLSGPGMMLGSAECTPGYYNNEGNPGGNNSLLGSQYGGGPEEFFQIMRDWRAKGDLDGLEVV